MIINFNNLGASGGGSGSGSTVTWRQDLTAGTQIAQITINGTPQNVYAPSGGSGSDIIQNYQIVSALTEVEGEESTSTLSGYTFDFSAATTDSYGLVQDSEYNPYVCILDVIDGTNDMGITDPGFYYCDWNTNPAIPDDNQWHSYTENGWMVRRNGYVIDAVSPTYSGEEIVDVTNAGWEPSAEITTAATSVTATVKVITEGTVAYVTADGKFYQYLNGEWVEIELGGSTASTDYLPLITSLPASPVDGAVYNYNGRLIRYINGAGNWGEWRGPVNRVKQSAPVELNQDTVLHYVTIPSSMDGQMICHIFQNAFYNMYFFYDEGGECIRVCSDSGATSPIATGATIYKDGVEVHSKYVFDVYTTWTDGQIVIETRNKDVLIDNLCSTSINDPHYELYQINNSPIGIDTGSTEYSKTVYTDQYGNVVGLGFSVKEGVVKVNGAARVYLQENGLASSYNLPDFYAPTASGASGTVLVSAGNTAPVWQTLQTALGIKAIWTGTQAQYEALAPNYDNTTLYFIVEE